MDGGLTVIVRTVGTERYIVIADDEHKFEALVVLDRWECDESLSFGPSDLQSMALALYRDEKPSRFQLPMP